MGVLQDSMSLGSLATGAVDLAQSDEARVALRNKGIQQQNRDSLLSLAGRATAAGVGTVRDVNKGNLGANPSAGDIAQNFGQNLINPYSRYKNLGRLMNPPNHQPGPVSSLTPDNAPAAAAVMGPLYSGTDTPSEVDEDDG